MELAFGAIALFAIFIFTNSVKVLNEYERGVVFRLGRLRPEVGPGLVLLIPVVDRMVRVSLRLVAMDVPTQDIITRDNVSVKVNAVLYFRVTDPNKAITNVDDFLFATSQLAQTTLRSILGRADLDALLAERDKLNHDLQEILDQQTEPWGIKVANVEVKHVDLPPEMQRAMARQAEAERNRRAKVINAEGEMQAAAKLAQAADTIGSRPYAMQMRYLQTLLDVATNHNSTTIFPLPIDLIKPFLERAEKAVSSGEKDS